MAIHTYSHSLFEKFTCKASHATKVNPTSEQDSLSLEQKDKLYNYQMTRRHPPSLTPLSFWAACFLESEYGSTRVYDKLRKANILTEDGIVDTTKIGKHFAHQLAIISNKQRQKDLIELLFWWEEECQRLNKLLSEKTDLEGAVLAVQSAALGHDQPQDGRQLRQFTTMLERINEKLNMEPSQRIVDLENDQDKAMSNHLDYLNGMQYSEFDTLPEYSR